ncbi:hypothetical protein [Desulfomonile tiedjei]|nr:hypothetical protein [Desulfomonile tiedjei]
MKGQVSIELSFLKKQIVMRYFLDEVDYQPYWAVLNFISSSLFSLSDDTLLTDDETAWRSAIEFAREKALLNPSIFDDPPDRLTRLHSRERAVAEAARYFRNRKCQLHLDMGKIVMDDNELERITQELDSKIRIYGGRRFAEYLFDKMKPIFCPSQERYHLIRRPTTAPSPSQRQTPFGYLINLSVKHLESRRIVLPNQAKILNEILETATMLAGLFDVQPYHFAENIQIPPHRFISAVSEHALFDRIFAFPQWRPSDLTGILRGLFKWVEADPGSAVLDWTIEDAATLVESIIRLCKGNNEPHFFHVSLLRRELANMPEQTLQALLTVFSHDASEVNHGFLSPVCVPQRCRDFMFKPLVKLNAGEYCLMSSSGCAPAFYEAIAMALRDICGQSTDKKIGDSLEQYVRQVLVKKGITLVHGEYQFRSIPDGRCAKDKHLRGDCDLAVETADTIILFEVKKQPFTRPSRAGKSGELLHDLAKGFVRGHKQLVRQAIILKESGSLVLQSDQGEYELQSNGRAVERVFVTLDDYGAFQDQVLANGLLEFMTFVGISSEDQGLQKKLEKVRSECLELRECLMRLLGPSERPFDRPFFNCRFISLPQLLVMLDEVTCNESLRQSLWRTRSVSYGTRDFYAEHFYNQQLRRQHDNRMRPSLSSKISDPHAP